MFASLWQLTAAKLIRFFINQTIPGKCPTEIFYHNDLVHMFSIESAEEGKTVTNYYQLNAVPGVGSTSGPLTYHTDALPIELPRLL